MPEPTAAAHTPWLHRLIAPRFLTRRPGILLAVAGLLMRLVFAAVLLRYFWASALTKVEGFGLSINAYAQILPRQMEAAGYDASALGFLAHAIVGLGTLAEFILPLLILIGLFTRLSALGMIGFIIVMSLTDIYGHGVGAETVGAWFDRFPDAAIADQRLLWTGLLAVLALSGGGWLSCDRWLAGEKRQPRTADQRPTA